MKVKAEVVFEVPKSAEQIGDRKYAIKRTVSIPEREIKGLEGDALKERINDIVVWKMTEVFGVVSCTITPLDAAPPAKAKAKAKADTAAKEKPKAKPARKAAKAKARPSANA